jgi:hypothetical protein
MVHSKRDFAAIFSALISWLVFKCLPNHKSSAQEAFGIEIRVVGPVGLEPKADPSGNDI